MNEGDLILSKPERDIIRRAFMGRVNGTPSVTEGFHVKRWATGPNKGKPKLTAAIQGMLNRRLITLEQGGHRPRAKFTDRGLQALKLMAMDRRLLDPECHRQLIEELAQIP